MILRRGIYAQRLGETVLIPDDNATWTNIVGDVVTGIGTIDRSTNSPSWINGGSFGSLPLSSNGKLSFNLTSLSGYNITNGYGFFGLDPVAGSLNDNINYAFYFRNGELRIYENATQKVSLGNSFTGSEIWEIERISDTLYFKKDGIVIYTSPTTTNSELYFCCSILLYLGAENLKIIY